MFTKHATQVLVVGAGPVGLATALALRHRNVEVEIIDRDWRPAAHSYALAVHPGAMRLLSDLGVADTIAKAARRVSKIALYDDNTGRAEININQLGGEYGYVYVMRQDVFERVLEQKLREAGVKVGWGRRLAALEPATDEVRATIDDLGEAPGGYAIASTTESIERTSHLAAKYVVGADGHESFVRRHLAIDDEHRAARVAFAVFEFRTDADLSGEMRLVLGEQGAAVAWPMPDGDLRLGFQLDTATLADQPRAKARLPVQVAGRDYPALGEERLHELLAAYMPWFDGRVVEQNWAMVVQFTPRLVRRFGQGRCWLVGDAAHFGSPVSVRSMNVGLAEGVDLAERLQSAVTARGAGSEFEVYSEAGLRNWRRLLCLNGVTAGPLVDPWVEQNADRIAAHLPAAGDELGRLLEQVGLALPE